MATFQRPLVIILLLLTALATLVATGALTLWAQNPQNPPQTATAPATTPATNPAANPNQPALLLAADQHFAWLALPGPVGEKDPIPGFQLAVKEHGRDTWRLVTINNSAGFTGNPAALAVVSADPRAAASEAAAYANTSAYVLRTDGQLTAFSRSDFRPFPKVPNDLIPIAATGGYSGGIYVLARGPAALATRPVPTTATAPATATATTPQTAPATLPAPESQGWRLLRFADGNWRFAPDLGPVTAPDTPAADAPLAIASTPNRLFVAWYARNDGRILYIRSVNPADPNTTWSDTLAYPLPPDVPSVSTLHAVAIDGTVYFTWPAIGDDLQKLRLFGVALSAAGTTREPRDLPPVDLSPILPSGDPAGNLAVARESNSLLVLARRGDQLHSLLADPATGKILGEPREFSPRRPDVPNPLIRQNVVIMGLLVLMVVALWQWRARPMIFALPKGMRISRVFERLLSGLIDLVVPALAVLIAFELYREGRWSALTSRWVDILRRPEIWWETRELMWVLIGYITHVTLGELLLGRSLGKSILGLRVTQIDGTTPTPLAIILRNLFKIPELTFPPLLAFMLINSHRQRLGDVLARTLVLRPLEPGETPPQQPPREE